MIYLQDHMDLDNTLKIYLLLQYDNFELEIIELCLDKI